MGGPTRELAGVDLSDLPRMVRWYSPAFLVALGIRGLITNLIRWAAREHISDATRDGAAPEVMLGIVKLYDYSRAAGSSEAPLWLDYVANFGEGFDSTYAVASLIAQEKLDIPGIDPLPSSEIVILGNNKVGPAGTWNDYKLRFELPYAMALPHKPQSQPRRLFALPADSDWFDGLNEFDRTFCRARYSQSGEHGFAGWECPQHRNYFAIRLPHDWWIWGADIHLSRPLDLGQVLYFRKIAETIKASGAPANIVLCVAGGEWRKQDASALPGRDSFSFFVETAQSADAGIRLVLSGEPHHYSRFASTDSERSYVIAGGGGAYLSSTHDVPRKQPAAAPDGEDIALQRRSGSGDQGSSTAACWPSR